MSFVGTPKYSLYTHLNAEVAKSPIAVAEMFLELLEVSAGGSHAQGVPVKLEDSPATQMRQIKVILAMALPRPGFPLIPLDVPMATVNAASKQSPRLP